MDIQTQDKLHLANIKSLPTILSQLEYCIDNGITSTNCSAEILDLLEDLKDQVEENVRNNTKAEEAYIIECDAMKTPDMVILGEERKPLPARPDWEIDERGNVFTTRGSVAATEFNLRYGGVLVRPDPRGPRLMVAMQVLLAFNPQITYCNGRVIYKDGDVSNVKLSNLVWARGKDDNDKSI